MLNLTNQARWIRRLRWYNTQQPPHSSKQQNGCYLCVRCQSIHQCVVREFYFNDVIIKNCNCNFIALVTYIFGDMKTSL